MIKGIYGSLFVCLFVYCLFARIQISLYGTLFQVVSLHLGNGKVKNITKEEALLIKELEVILTVNN